jgi:hypothetical protein
MAIAMMNGPRLLACWGDAYDVLAQWVAKLQGMHQRRLILSTTRWMDRIIVLRSTNLAGDIVHCITAGDSHPHVMY